MAAVLDEAAPTRPPRARAAAAAALAALLLAGATWWATHPDRFDPVGDRWELPDAVIGQPILVGMFIDPGGAVTLRSAEPRVRTNTAHADIRVLVCDGRPDTEPVGSQRGSAAVACQAIHAPSGIRIGKVVSGRSRQLLLEITPRREGRVLVDGVRLSYRAGVRFGADATGVVVDIRTLSADGSLQRVSPPGTG